MDLWPLVPHVRAEAGVGPEWDGVIERQLHRQFHDRGFRTEVEIGIPQDVIAEAVAAAANVVATEHHHQRHC